MVAGAVEDQSAIVIKGNGLHVCGVGLDRDRIVGRERGVGFPENGIANQPVKRNRLVVARSDHPPDQIPSLTLGFRYDFSRHTRTDLDAVGSEHKLLPNRSRNVEVGLSADKTTGLVRFSCAANPVEPDLYRLVLGADLTLWAQDANLEFAPRFAH